MTKNSSWLDRLLGRQPTKSSADIAKERLTVLVASDNKQLRNRLTQANIDKMKHEIAEVVKRYIGDVALDDIAINRRTEEDMDILQMSISLPDKK